MLYYAYEFQRQLAKPVRLWANALEQVYSSPYNPLADTWFGKSVAASAEIVARLTQNYGKPALRPEDDAGRQRDRRGQRRDPAAQAVLPAAALPSRHARGAIPRCWWWRR